MIRINLIPHRTQFRQKQILEYITVFFVTLAVVLAGVIAVNIWSSQGLTDLQEEYNTLVAQNNQLSKKIGELRNLDGLRKDVEGKLDIVDELQAGRFRTLITLDAVAEAIPQNVWLTNFGDSDGKISITGFGESSKAVANFMRALEASTMFDKVSLNVDQESVQSGRTVRGFTLQFNRLSLTEQEAKMKKAEKDKKQ